MRFPERSRCRVRDLQAAARRTDTPLPLALFLYRVAHDVEHWTVQTMNLDDLSAS